ncbi:MAG TPA: hypothetical protein VKF41_00190 [Bryobacteraceae bacterium]|nr:hypothetical protein [Bryobacteraceae bacterium]
MTQTRTSNPSQRTAARAAEREQRTREKIQEEVAKEYTAEVKTVNVLDLEGDAGVAGQVFEVWTPDGRCVVVTDPNPITAKVIVCVDQPGTYLVKYLVNNQVMEQRNVATEPIALAVELS